MSATEEHIAIVEASSDREIIISCVFSAPRRLVWDAMTDFAQVSAVVSPGGTSDLQGLNPYRFL